MAVTFIADRGDARLRLDQAIVRRLTDVPQLSRTRVQRWIDEQLVLVNGAPARRASDRIAAGDRILVEGPQALVRRAAPAPETLPLDVLFEDEYLLALNKAPGVVSHPTYKHSSGTLLNAVLGKLRGKDGVAPALINRLDKDTSGVLLVAKSRAVHARVQKDMAAGLVRKEYIAVVHGRPKRGRGVIALPLGRDPYDRRRVIVREDGQPSETRYELVASVRRGEACLAPTTSLLRCELITGRTHQIRVHLAASGWPIVGDAVYGRPGSREFPRQALHAWRITFPSPAANTRIQLTAPLPADLMDLLVQLGISLPAEDEHALRV